MDERSPRGLDPDLSAWIEAVLQEGAGIGLAIMDSEGALLYTNPGMRWLLTGDTQGAPKLEGFLHPSFHRLVEITGSGAEFAGAATFGDARGESRSAHLRAQRAGDRVVAVAQLDTEDIHLQSQRLAALNREVNNLQRALIKEKRQLERANEQLRALHEEKDRFLGMAAHDLRNPLVGMRNLAGLLGTGLVSEPEALEGLSAELERSARHMLELVEDLLDLNAIQRGRLELKLAPIDPVTLCRAALTRIAPMALAKEITLRLEAHDPPVSLHCDPRRLGQVLDNLLGNAVKFSPACSTVRLSVERGPRGPRLCVIDQGPGIPEQDRARIFEPFHKGAALPTGGEASSGLGLAICQRIVAAHGGTLRATQAADGGARMVLELPEGPERG
jgi:signal transduction histidine kinase